MKCLLIVLSLWLVFSYQSYADVRVDENTLMIFASLEEGKRLLTEQDEFIDQMSPFDRGVRMKTARDVSKTEFLEFVGRNVLQWEDHEKKALESALRQIIPGLGRLRVPDLGNVYLIKTTGAEEGNIAYTRGKAIVLPKSILHAPKRELQRLLAHEIFHILSRTISKLRNPLYEVIGFHYCGEIELPSALRARKMTNPDAPKNEYCIRVHAGDEAVWVTPILFSRTATYNKRRGGKFFDYLTFALMVVARANESDPSKAIIKNQQPKLLEINEISGFFEQVGKNTRYIFHPEEILADNFALLVLEDRNVQTPEILHKMKNVLAATSSLKPAVPADSANPRF